MNVFGMIAIPYATYIQWGLFILTPLVAIYFKITKKKDKKSFKETYTESNQFENLTEDEFEKKDKKQDWEGL
jgi:hypothetical protein|tara:strand:+ start:158 stop:373 length:216 start_codon:yes stop_codon:yes gene_type:complete